MAPISMTLSDLKPRFQGHDIIQRQIFRKRYKIAPLKLRPYGAIQIWLLLLLLLLLFYYYYYYYFFLIFIEGELFLPAIRS